LEMGFDKSRAELAVKKTGGCKYQTGICHKNVVAKTNIAQWKER
jgi:hypothetical protein